MDSRAIKVSMAKQTAAPAATQASTTPMMSSLRPWSAPPAPPPRVLGSQPANMIQAQAHARLMQLSALNMLMPAAASSSATGPRKAKKTQQDPGKVKRTVFISKLPQDVTEQVTALPAFVHGLRTPAGVASGHSHHSIMLGS